MSLPHYFLQDQIISLEAQECFALALAPDDAKHMKVARLAPGEHIAVIDAASDYFECEIVRFVDGVPFARICKKLQDKRQCPHITLVQGLAKGEKMDFVIRHATELGVSRFIPLECNRSIMKLTEKKALDRVSRWNAVAKNAAMQSGQTHLPCVEMPLSVARFCQHAHDFNAIFVCWEEAPLSEHLSSAVMQLAYASAEEAAQLRVALVVGPEGGIDSKEIDALMSCENAHLVSLGSSILRTETAGIVAPALVLFSLGQLGGLYLGKNFSCDFIS